MRFAYLKDPLFLFCVCLYFVNRWIAKPYLPNPFSSNYLNDVICIPFWVPIMLFMMRKLRLRNCDRPPELSEILIPLLIWSWAFEIFLPHTAYFKRFDTADHVDILCYSVGALVAGVFWKWRYGRLKEAKSPY
jgi:hypothetical protein